MNKLLRKIGLRADVHALETSLGPDKGTVRSLLKHGRAFLYRGEDYPGVAYVEWSLGELHLGAGLGTDHYDKLTPYLRIPGLSLFFGFKVPLSLIDAVKSRCIAEKYDEVYIANANVYESTIFWSLMHSKDSWSSTTPKWRSGSFDMKGLLLGAPKYTQKVLETRDVTIMMPEGNYEWSIELDERTWTRDRWFTKTIRGYNAEAKDGNAIPVPGKGTCSWNCGPDSYSGLSGSCNGGYKDAVSRIASAVLKERAKRGARQDYSEGGRFDLKEKTA